MLRDHPLSGLRIVHYLQKQEAILWQNPIQFCFSLRFSTPALENVQWALGADVWARELGKLWHGCTMELKQQNPSSLRTTTGLPGLWGCQGSSWVERGSPQGSGAEEDIQHSGKSSQPELGGRVVLWGGT